MKQNLPLQGTAENGIAASLCHFESCFPDLKKSSYIYIVSEHGLQTEHKR